MRGNERVTARRHLDKRLNPLRDKDALARPPKGWVKAIREALGMTTAQLADRLGVSQPRAVNIEQAEVSGVISLQSLERAAQALDCELVYALVPRKPLEEIAGERAVLRASKRLQAPDTDKEVRELAAWLVKQSGSALWEKE